MSPRWHAALAWALTGTEMALPEPDAPAPDRLVAALADAGWTRERLAAHAAAQADAGTGWPHPVPDALRAGLGAAQLFAALGLVRAQLGLDGLAGRGPSSRTVLTPDERRLLADVPPHHMPH